MGIREGLQGGGDEGLTKGRWGQWGDNYRKVDTNDIIQMCIYLIIFYLNIFKLNSFMLTKLKIKNKTINIMEKN